MKQIMVSIERTGKKVKVGWKKNLVMKDLIVLTNNNPVEVVPVVNGSIVTDVYVVQEHDKVELLSVVSGG